MITRNFLITADPRRLDGNVSRYLHLMGSSPFAFFSLGSIQTKEFHLEPATYRNSQGRYILVIVIRKFRYSTLTKIENSLFNFARNTDVDHGTIPPIPAKNTELNISAPR